MIVKDEKLTLENIKTSILAEQLVLMALFRREKYTFDMSLGLNQVNKESFTQLDLLKLAPIVVS
jgi:hypothetical protein